MPESAAAMLVFPELDALEEVCDRLALPWFSPSVGEEKFYEKVFRPLARVLKADLRVAHLELIRAELDPEAKVVQHHVVANTSAGPRELSPFRLEYWGDNGGGNRWSWPDDFCVGVPLSSRYYPTWLDWEEEHGTDGKLRLNTETVARIEAARSALAEPLPEIAGAEIASLPIVY